MESKHEIVKTDADLPIRFFYSNDGKRSSVVPHFHDDIEIVYILSGNIILTRNTLETILKPGDVAVINPNIIHATRSENPQTTAYVLQVSYDFLQKCQLERKQIFFDIPILSNTELTRSQAEGLERLKQDLAEFQQVYMVSDDYYSLKLNSLIFDITYTLFHSFSSEQETGVYANQFKHFKRLSVVTSYIREHYNEPLSLGEMSDLINVTPAYLSRFFKKTLGMTFLEYTALIRLEHAYTDIVTTDYPISFISDKNGFANYPLFNQKFKEKYGDTPLKLRKKTKDHRIVKYE